MGRLYLQLNIWLAAKLSLQMCPLLWFRFCVNNSARSLQARAQFMYGGEHGLV